jgi:hypothetical protein
MPLALICILRDSKATVSELGNRGDILPIVAPGLMLMLPPLRSHLYLGVTRRTTLCHPRLAHKVPATGKYLRGMGRCYSGAASSKLEGFKSLEMTVSRTADRRFLDPSVHNRSH